MSKFKTVVLCFVCFFSMNASVFASLPSSSPVNDDPSAPSLINAIKEFRSLPRSERKTRLREVRHMLKEYRALRRAGKADETDHTLVIILAILIPPLGVYLYQNKITTKFWISLVLTLLFWLPGAIYSLLVVTGNA